jgi:hypothetical protein
MINEADALDYEKILGEGPEEFVAELDEGVISQPEAVQGIAASYIRSKTAAADPGIRERFEAAWLERVETVRASAAEQKAEPQKKEAAQREDWQDAPDESLFD